MAPPPRHLLRLLPAAARLSRLVRRLRRVDRCSSLTRPCVGCPRLGSLAARSLLVCALLPPLLRSRLPIPLEWASSSRGGVLASCSVHPHGRTRSARRVWCGAHPRRHLERCGCSVCGCCDCVSDEPLVRALMGDVQPADGGPRARMSSRESLQLENRNARNQSSFI